MRINIFFNHPVGEAIVSLGGSTIEDKNYLFRLGLIEQGKPGIRWHKSGWVDRNEVNQLKVPGFRKGTGYKITIQRQSKIDNKIASTEIVIDKEWPPDAIGGTSVNRYWDF